MTMAINHSQVHLRVLTLYTSKPFVGYGSDLRRAITASFKDIPLLHNHNGMGFDYRSPRIRYVVIDKLPKLLSFEEGINVIEEIYKEKPSLKVGHKIYTVTGTELDDRIEDIGILGADTYRYSSITPWLALNEGNYSVFVRTGSLQDRRFLLSKILVGNLLSLSKSLNIEIRETIRININSFQETDLYAGKLPLLGIKVNFETNYRLPSFVGVGKLVSKGFGIMRMLPE